MTVERPTCRKRGGVGASLLLVASHATSFLMATLLLCVTCAGLVGCKDTDLLKKIVYHPYATVVDPNKTVVVNDPDGEETMPALSAFDLTEDAQPVDTVENIIVPTLGEPNVAGTARHSVFGTVPRLPGIEATDPVRLVDSTSDTAIDHEVDAKEEAPSAQSVSPDPDPEQQSDEPREQRTATGDGTEPGDTGSEWTPVPDKDSQGVASGNDGGTGDSGDGGGGAGDSGDSGESGSGASGESGSGDEGAGVGDGDLDPGVSARESGGYDGADITYDPGNRLLEPEKSERIAAIGQAAVLVQAIGGKGALAAMDAYTYQGLNASGSDAPYASSFADVFGDELADGFEVNALIWRRDGSAPGYLADANGKDNVDALVKAVANSDGTGGTIVFDGEYGGQADYFSSKQLKAFEEAGVQLVPVDLSSPQGILDAATAVGKVLADSDAIDQDAQANAAQYRDAFNGIVEAAAATHGGTLAAAYARESVESYPDCPVGRQEVMNAYGHLLGDYELGVSYTGEDYRIETESGLWLSAGDACSSFFWRAAGVVKRGGNGGLAWCLVTDVYPNMLSGSSNGGAIASWSGGPAVYNNFIGENLSDWQMDTTRNPYGLGSRQFPYLIASAAGDHTAAESREAFLKAAENKYSPYYAYRWFSRAGSAGLNPDDDGAPSVIGVDQDYTGGNLFASSGLSLSDVVRENPCGLLGNWTQGNMESVLESAWLADLYSKKPENSFYEPVNNMDGFSVRIGDAACTTVKQAVNAFYQTVYRYDASGVYDNIVTDSGRGLS